MSLSINDSSGLLDSDMRLFTERRFQFALSRFDSRIDGVEVTVTRTGKGQRAGKGQGIDQHECSVAIDIRRSEKVSLIEIDTDLKKCVVRAAERSGRAVGRSVERWHSQERHRPACASTNNV
ncbi:hypothetical protein LF1_21270 [Rubripirellula obstinata]|uniref:Sigma 54 modulation protein / S30EA ribosomal protein n=1 Tax=Rubripirellula obstinata TaxID=406547 RepID=A0A5B1CJG6_9BACT|nr:hypothetical protein LF1_21270 [Rubripirellula obstinata]